MNRNDIAYEQAMRLVLENAPLMPGETIPLQQTVGLTLAASAIAQVDSPSADVTLRDGYAVHYRDVSDAGTDRVFAQGQIDQIGFDTAEFVDFSPGFGEDGMGFLVCIL